MMDIPVIQTEKVENIANKLCLGTVQFGLNYGIKNELHRQPNEQESFAVLKAAIASGIQYLDTASVYGNAEEILGNFNISNYGVKVISKLRPGISVDIVATVQREVRKSLQRLRMKTVDGYLLHAAQDFYCPDIIKGLQISKEKNLIKNIGVSVYEPRDALNVVKSGVMDYIQVPYNVFDQRLNETDFFELAEKNRVKVFARSSFLQGLLLMDIADVPQNLQQSIPYLVKFNNIIQQYGFSCGEAALLFACAHKGINKVLIGVETKEQLQNNISSFQRQNDFELCYKELLGNFTNIDKKIISPNKWSC